MMLDSSTVPALVRTKFESEGCPVEPAVESRPGKA